MILAASIAVALGVGWLAYRVLFYDVGDFLDGVDQMTRGKHRFLYDPRRKPVTPKDCEDDSRTSGFRVVVLLVLSVGSGYSAFVQLHKFFD